MFKRFWWVFLVALITGPLLGLLVGGIVAYVSPKQYEADAVLQVRPTFAGVLITTDTALPPTTTPATEIELLLSRDTLDAAIETLDLENRWGLPKDETRDRLRACLSAENLRGTDLIRLRARTTHPTDARLIAEAVSNTYRNRRVALESERTDAAQAELREAVRSQEDLVEEKRKVLTQLIRNHDLLYRPPGSSIPPFNNPDLEPSKSRTDELRHAQLEGEIIQLESQIDTLLHYDGDQLLTYAAGLNLPENIVTSLHPQYLEAKRQLDALKQAGLGDSHPNVRQQEKIIEGLRQNLDGGIIDLRETLRAQLELAEEQAERLSKKHEQEGPQLTRARITYDDAKADFETAQALLEKLKIKLISEEMQQRISEDPVIIHSTPVEPTRPIAPNIPRHLLLGSAAGLLLGLLAPLFLIPILNTATRGTTSAPQ